MNIFNSKPVPWTRCLLLLSSGHAPRRGQPEKQLRADKPPAIAAPAVLSRQSKARQGSGEALAEGRPGHYLFEDDSGMNRPAVLARVGEKRLWAVKLWAGRRHGGGTIVPLEGFGRRPRSPCSSRRGSFEPDRPAPWVLVEAAPDSASKKWPCWSRWRCCKHEGRWVPNDPRVNLLVNCSIRRAGRSFLLGKELTWLQYTPASCISLRASSVTPVMCPCASRWADDAANEDY